jgi:hypothetical protein
MKVFLSPPLPPFLTNEGFYAPFGSNGFFFRLLFAYSITKGTLRGSLNEAKR